MFSKIMRPRTLLILVLLMAIAALTYGFAAQITLGTSNTVVASGDIALTNYTADLTWALNGVDPSVSPTATVTFTSGVPTAVSIGYFDGATWDWASVTCTDGGGGVWTCPFTGINVFDVQQVEVVATGPN